MTKVFKTPFGALGDKQEVPVPTQTDGSVSYEQGFGIDYNRDYKDPQGKDIEREKLNQLFYDLTQAVGELQQLGYMKWQAGQYKAGARVELDGKVYRATQTTSNKPPAAGWEIVNEASTPFTRTLLSRTTATQVRSDLGLGSSSLADLSQGVGPSEAHVMSQKAVTDALNTKVGLTGKQTIAGTKTFSSFPVTPSAAPTANYQVANKKYVDDSAIGVGQTWQNMTASRNSGTTYTNSTGKPIMVAVTVNDGSGGDFLTITVGGETLENFDPVYHYNYRCFIVPAGSSYSVSSGRNPIVRWMELR